LFKANLILIAPIAFVFIIRLAFKRGTAQAARAATIYALSGLPFVGAILLWNWIRFGNVLTFGYSSLGMPLDLVLGFRSPVAIGLFGLLFSPGKSFFLYNVLFFFAFSGVAETRKRCAEYLGAAVLSFVALVLFYSTYWGWSGDWGWGPRYLTPLVPVLFPMAAFGLKNLWYKGRTGRAVIAGVAAYGIATQFMATAVYTNSYSRLNVTRGLPENINLNTYIDDLLIEHFVPCCSPLLGIP
jgi:hypothetical protein